MIEKRHLRHAEQTRRFPPRWLLGFADFSGTVTPHPREEPRHFCSDEERHGGYITFACLPLRQPVLSLPLPSTPHTAAYLCIYLCTTSRRIYPFPSYTFSPPIFAPFSRSLPNFVPRTFVSPSSSPRNDSLSLSVFLLLLLLLGCSSENRGIQMTSDDEYPRLSRPAGNCRYPYFCPRSRTVHHEGAESVHTRGSAPFFSRAFLHLFLPHNATSRHYNLALLSSGISYADKLRGNRSFRRTRRVDPLFPPLRRDRGGVKDREL